MNRLIRKSRQILCAGLIAALAVVPPAGAAVHDWMLFGDNAKEYAIGYSEGVSFAGNVSGGIKSTGFNMSGSGIMARRVPAKEWWGKRLRFSCLIQTYQTQGTVGAWLGLETKSEGQPQPISVTHTLNEPLSGTTEWTKRSIVLTIPPGTENLLIGIVLNGRGLAFLNNVRLDEEFDLPKSPDLNDFKPSR